MEKTSQAATNSLKLPCSTKWVVHYLKGSLVLKPGSNSQLSVWTQRSACGSRAPGTAHLFSGCCRHKRSDCKVVKVPLRVCFSQMCMQIPGFHHHPAYWRVTSPSLTEALADWLQPLCCLPSKNSSAELGSAERNRDNLSCSSNPDCFPNTFLSVAAGACRRASFELTSSKTFCFRTVCSLLFF